uniref:Uncharacterized protein orf919 n=1 Tax=Heterostelium pallidum TaxID=13642 RepID=Q5ILI2_HETPA|nr:hypothetical protein PopaoMp44 [Heterostelium pallidum]AAU00628.1 unknown [Heterostelium pallidum]
MKIVNFNNEYEKNFLYMNTFLISIFNFTGNLEVVTLNKEQDLFLNIFCTLSILCLCLIVIFIIINYIKIESSVQKIFKIIDLNVENEIKQITFSEKIKCLLGINKLTLLNNAEKRYVNKDIEYFNFYGQLEALNLELSALNEDNQDYNSRIQVIHEINRIFVKEDTYFCDIAPELKSKFSNLLLSADVEFFEKNYKEFSRIVAQLELVLENIIYTLQIKSCKFSLFEYALYTYFIIIERNKNKLYLYFILFLFAFLSYLLLLFKAITINTILSIFLVVLFLIFALLFRFYYTAYLNLNNNLRFQYLMSYVDDKKQENSIKTILMKDKIKLLLGLGTLNNILCLKNEVNNINLRIKAIDYILDLYNKKEKSYEEIHKEITFKFSEKSSINNHINYLNNLIISRLNNLNYLLYVNNLILFFQILKLNLKKNLVTLNYSIFQISQDIPQKIFQLIRCKKEKKMLSLAFFFNFCDNSCVNTQELICIIILVLISFLFIFKNKIKMKLIYYIICIKFLYYKYPGLLNIFCIVGFRYHLCTSIFFIKSSPLIEETIKPLVSVNNIEKSLVNICDKYSEGWLSYLLGHYYGDGSIRFNSSYTKGQFNYSQSVGKLMYYFDVKDNVMKPIETKNKLSNMEISLFPRMMTNSIYLEELGFIKQISLLFGCGKKKEIPDEIIKYIDQNFFIAILCDDGAQYNRFGIDYLGNFNVNPRYRLCVENLSKESIEKLAFAFKNNLQLNTQMVSFKGGYRLDIINAADIEKKLLATSYGESMYYKIKLHNIDPLLNLKKVDHILEYFENEINNNKMSKDNNILLEYKKILDTEPNFKNSARYLQALYDYNVTLLEKNDLLFNKHAIIKQNERIQINIGLLHKKIILFGSTSKVMKDLNVNQLDSLQEHCGDNIKDSQLRQLLKQSKNLKEKWVN